MSGRKAREERREQRLQQESQADSQERRQRLIRVGSAVAFLAIAVVAVLIVVSQNQSSGGDTNLEETAAVKKELAGIPQSEMTLGDPKAKVTLFEYGDLQCPVCKAFSEEALPDVIDTRVRSGDARVEFLNYTIINEESVPAGAAAVAAGKQGRGWNFVELFYRNQGEEASGYVTDDFLTEVARGAGVPDIGKWNKDRKSKAVLSEVSKSTNEAQELGFSGTPSFAVSGPSTSGKRPLGSTGSAADLEEAIDEAG
jgi:protein-disulfide isomerase